MSARRSISMVLVWLCAAAGALVCSAPALAQREHEFSKSFASEGSGDGQLMRPGQLVVNEEIGDVYVVDRGNGRVEIFSASGAYVGQFDGSASPTGAFSWPTTVNGITVPEGSIAVDNSTNPLDPSRGDVYVLDTGHGVVDKFSASGVYIGQVTGTSPSSPFPYGLYGVAVDPSGGLWVQAGGTMDQFNDAASNEYVSSIQPKVRSTSVGSLQAATLGRVGFAFSSEENFYSGVEPFFSKFTVSAEFSTTGEEITEQLDDEETTGFAVDLSSDDVYVDHETGVAAYSPSDSLVERFGSGLLEVSEGIAVDSATGTVYTSDASGEKIDAFTAFVVPDATTGAASDLAETSATVSGVVNPDGLPVTSCVFEYGTSESYGQSAVCFPSPGSGTEPITVTTQLKGLEPLTKYHFRLNVSNANGANEGRDRTFVTPEPVALSEETVSDVSSTSALFSAQVDPGGAETTYKFEYGTSESYGESVPVPAGDLGAGTSREPVSVRPQDLHAETTYHVRLVASNLLGTIYGPNQTFTTQASGGAFSLPDGREWEMVSPPNKEGSLIYPIREDLVQASAEGGAVSYVANGPMGFNVVGNPAPTKPTQVLARRGASAWYSEDIATPIRKPAKASIGIEYFFFSSDLSQGLIERPESEPLSPEVTESTPYLRDNKSGSYTPLITGSNVTPPNAQFGPPEGEDAEALAATPDLSHVLFVSPYALTSNAINLTRQDRAAGELNIYEWSGGRLQLVSVLPDGAASEGAQLGGDSPGSAGQNIRNQISNDGTRVFWTARRGNKAEPRVEGIYMSDMTTGRTIQVDAPASGVSLPPANKGHFELASADGSQVFFLDSEPLTQDSKLKLESLSEEGVNDLYVYDTITGSLTDLSVDQNPGEVADVQNKVVGASEDGSIVYFVAKGKLAEDAEAGKDNLYMASEAGGTWSSPRLVAVLSEEDANSWAGSGGEEMQQLSSRVSPNGRYLAFMSERSLTGYDNRDANSGEPDEEVFLYDEATSQLRCVSCNPTGARPDGIFDRGEGGTGTPLVDQPELWSGHWLAASIPGWTGLKNGVERGLAYQSRVLSNEGRMFFGSADALVAQDTNGREDVYEYEPQGVGNCVRSGGCVSLISSGTSSEESAFLDASETGDDVFFLTASRLVPGDVDSSLDVYDAHVCASAAPCVSAPVSPPPCSSGDSCKAAPSLQPAIFGAPASATFSGEGNVVPSSQTVSGGVPKQGTKRKAGHGKRKRKSKSKSKGGRKGRVKSSGSRKGLSSGQDAGRR